MSEKFAVETQDLTKRYDGVTVVDSLNLHVMENEVFGLLAPMVPARPLPSSCCWD